MPSKFRRFRVVYKKRLQSENFLRIEEEIREESLEKAVDYAEAKAKTNSWDVVVIEPANRHYLTLRQREH